MIKPIVGRGSPRALAACDDCGREEIVPCDYLARRGGTAEPNEGQVVKKLGSRGWVKSSGNLRCSLCAARGRALVQAREGKVIMTAKDVVKEVAAETLQPTPKQERLIILALENAYDDQAKRYRGCQTDKTVAEELGGAIRAGWVADLRARYFGPDGGNEEIEAIRASIGSLKSDFDKRILELRGEYCAAADALAKRLDAVCIAVGPRAGKVAS
ncbi:hypothetical protein ACEUZ9_000137 [Paracoccus litorisediminis]|uniref:hypothetical protein n=1 Tax=Paracoccus litorisediminis TaxID=2006130 RepID=UPI0037341E92